MRRTTIDDKPLSSKTLQTFIKMHEHKLNAKISRMKAHQLEMQLEDSLHGSKADKHRLG